MLTLLLLFIFVVVAAALWFQGLWSNIIILVNVLLAGMLALNYFEPLADAIDSAAPAGTYVYDFVVLWSLFLLCYLLLRLMAALASKHSVKFILPVELAGRTILALWIAWLFVGFVCVSLHTAPMAPHPFGSFQTTPESGNFLGLAPGRAWLSFMQSRSAGALSRSDESSDSPYDGDIGMRVFDPQSEFIMKYYSRRKTFAEQGDYNVAR